MNKKILQDLGITHILNVSDNIPNYFEHGKLINIEYSNVSIEDVEDAPIHIAFEQAYNFIDQALFCDKCKPDLDLSEEIKFGEGKLSQCDRQDFDTQTLKFDFDNELVTNWSTDEIKAVGLHCDLNAIELHKSNPKNKVLVHCAMGKSRSASMIIMFLMKKFSLPFKLAVQLLKSRREKIDINNGFIAQLEAFEEHGFVFSTESQGNEGDSTEAEEVSPVALC